ncbi:MAG: anthranilate synthase component II [bacterium]
MKLLMIDNYDSFTYNLVQYFGELGADIQVYRNDRITLEEIEELRPQKIVISPGPCTPKEAGISVELVKRFGKTVPILGVCLGHQSVGVAYGGRVVRAEKLMHGKTSQVFHDGKSIYRGLENPFTATRYHSLVIEQVSLPDCLKVTSLTEDKIIMGLRHKSHPVEGVQFHPESILTTEGKSLVKNFLEG